MTGHVYQYSVLTRPEAPQQVSEPDQIDMENVDYKRQPDIDLTRNWIEDCGGLCCGILRGGLFGLATNQIAVLSCWSAEDQNSAAFRQLGESYSWTLSEQETLQATVRPTEPEKISRGGIYVIRWIRMNTTDIAEYTQLCLETWPQFEATTQSRCFGVFQPLKQEPVSKLLMLTWYATLGDWEQSRNLDPDDRPKWARRSEMELSHWAQAGRLAY